MSRVQTKKTPVVTHPGLPECCYIDMSALQLDGVTVALLWRGVSGYVPVATNEVDGAAAEFADRMNCRLGVVPPQREAMLIGALCGWQAPGANPAFFNADGTFHGRSTGMCHKPPSQGETVTVRQWAKGAKVIK